MPGLDPLQTFAIRQQARCLARLLRGDCIAIALALRNCGHRPDEVEDDRESFHALAPANMRGICIPTRADTSILRSSVHLPTFRIVGPMQGRLILTALGSLIWWWAFTAETRMRIFKSLLVLLIGLTASLYVLQNVANIGAMRQQMDAANSNSGSAASWIAFALMILCQIAIAAMALKGAWDLFAARNGSADEFKEAKSVAVWAGGLSLLSWFLLSLMVGGGLFEWDTDSGQAALAKAFALGTTSALTILFVWGTKD
jgi:predicted small integral membrane protein